MKLSKNLRSHLLGFLLLIFAGASGPMDDFALMSLEKSPQKFRNTFISQPKSTTGDTTGAKFSETPQNRSSLISYSSFSLPGILLSGVVLIVVGISLLILITPKSFEDELKQLSELEKTKESTF